MSKLAMIVNLATAMCYVANFDGDEINGTRYALGDPIAEDVDAGTIRYLVQNGRITEMDPSDELVSSMGESQQFQPGLLDGSIGDLTAHLATVDDKDALAILRADEEAGKNRVGALDAIDARIVALG